MSPSPGPSVPFPFYFSLASRLSTANSRQTAGRPVVGIGAYAQSSLRVEATVDLKVWELGGRR